MESKKGVLFLLPATIGDCEPSNVIPQYNSEIINSLSEFIVEDIRTARRFLRKSGYRKDFDLVNFYLINKHTKMEDLPGFLAPALIGKDIGLLSEAGVPCVADPGAEIVRIAHLKRISVKPLSGPSSIILGLAASGFNGQHFLFHGYLPIKVNERDRKIRDIEKNIYRIDQTQIFIEAPYRNLKIFEALTKVCLHQTMLCIACDITLETEYIKTKSIHDWKKINPPIQKKPTVFLLYK